MCHSDDSRPPGVPEPGGISSHGPIELTSADGHTVFGAYQATPSTPKGRNVVVLPDVRGLHPFYADLAQRFAEAGFASIAVDYFGRVAGSGPRDDTFDWMSHFPALRPEHVRDDVAAAAQALRDQSPGPVFTVGFCFGGSQSWRLAASDLGLAGTIGFYGRPELVTDLVDGMTSPVLLLVAGDDAYSSAEDFEALDAQMTAAGKEHEMYVYDGAPHSFFDRTAEKWQDACADSWRRILAFTERHGA
jgi:carboxymethylenebutenolidase